MAEKPPSDVIRKVDVHDYVAAHAKPNGGWRSFLKSNLFTALVIFVLSQGLLVGGSLVAMWWRTAALSEWKGGVERDLEIFKSHGSPALRKDMEFMKAELTFRIGKLDERTTKIEADTEHFDVMEAENRRITAEIEKLKNEKK